MNELTQVITSELLPHKAFVLYKSRGNEYNSGTHYYMECHEIDDKGVMGAGAPVQEKLFADLVKYFSDTGRSESNIKGEIPAGLLYSDFNASNKVLVWWTPEQERVMHFIEGLHIPKGKAWQPALLWVMDNGTLSLYALKETVLGAELYRAPYHNVSSDGLVCLGSARVKTPECTFKARIEHAHQLFWGSEFTHLAGGNSIKGNLNTYWKAAIKSGKKFDKSLLLPNEKRSPKTIAQLIKSLK